MLTLTQLNHDEFILVTERYLVHGSKAGVMRALFELGLSLDQVLGLFIAVLDGQVVDSELTIRHFG